MTRISAIVLALLVPGTLAAQSATFRAIAFSPDSRLLAAGTGGLDGPGDLIVWDLGARKPLWQHRQPHGIASVAFANDGKVLAAGLFSADCKLLDTASGKERGVLTGHGKAARGVDFSPDGATLAVASYDHNVRLWDWAAGKLKHTLEGHTDIVYQVAFSQDGRLVASASADHTARLWDVGTGKPRQTLKQFQSLVRSLAFGPKDRWLAVGSWNIGTRVFDPATGALLRTFGEVHGDALALAPDGVTLAICGMHRRHVDLFTVDFRDPTDVERAEIQAQIAQLDDDAGAQRDAAGKALLRFGWCADSLLESASKESPSAEIKLRARRLRDTLRTKPAAVLSGHEDAVGCVAFSHDGRWLATAGADGLIILWDAKSRAKAFTLEGNPN